MLEEGAEYFNCVAMFCPFILLSRDASKLEITACSIADPLRLG